MAQQPYFTNAGAATAQGSLCIKGRSQRVLMSRLFADGVLLGTGRLFRWRGGILVGASWPIRYRDFQRAKALAIFGPRTQLAYRISDVFSFRAGLRTIFGDFVRQRRFDALGVAAVRDYASMHTTLSVTFRVDNVIRIPVR